MAHHLLLPKLQKLSILHRNRRERERERERERGWERKRDVNVQIENVEV
jgi:hypothetical protein